MSISILCANEEADEHFRNARDAFIHGVGHAAAAGIMIVDFPPLAIYEGYQSIQSFIEMGDEYCKGLEAKSDD